jgi:hypothetical protein
MSSDTEDTPLSTVFWCLPDISIENARIGAIAAIAGAVVGAWLSNY